MWVVCGASAACEPRVQEERLLFTITFTPMLLLFCLSEVVLLLRGRGGG